MTGARREQLIADLTRLLLFPLWRGGRKRLTDVFSPKLQANLALNLAQNLLVGNGFALLKLGNDLGLLVDTRGQLLLREPLRLAALENDTTHAEADGLVCTHPSTP